MASDALRAMGKEQEGERQQSSSLLCRFASCHSPYMATSSLFGSDSEDEDGAGAAAPATASCTPPTGLFLFPSLIAPAAQHALAASLASTIFTNHANQAMFFSSPSRSPLPAFLAPVLDSLPSLLSALPAELHAILFDSTHAQQAIFNLYHPGQGISPHVDLPHRYEDGIIGISLCGSAVMEFTRGEELYAVLLRSGDVYVLSGEARWEWKHGIAAREEDWVEGEEGERVRLRRRLRISVTLRRMKKGADVVGGELEGLRDELEEGEQAREVS